MKKLLKTRKFYMLSAILLSIVGVIVFIILNALSSNIGSIKFKAYTGYYESNQNPITDIVNSEDGKPYYSIKNFYKNFDTWSKDSTGNVIAEPDEFDSSKYIGIDDMTDLVAFSRLCNPDFNNSSYTSFLGYKYILTNNITTTSSSLYFMPIGTDSEHPFRGEFNGNGYDITNMSFVNIQSTGDTDHFKENYPKTQEKIQYFAMFSNNEGTICNFGIINANLSFNYSSNGLFYKVAMICGENQTGGTINKVYVRDLRDADNKRAGIMPFGGYTISGLVFSNKGTVSNSYVAYSTVVNGAVDDFSDFSELIYENSGTGTESNLFFYNDAITKIGTSETYEAAQSFDKSSVEIAYSSLGMQVKRTVYGTYCQKLEYLDIAINATNTPDKIWYVPSNYGTAEDDVKTLVVTPMLRGLEFNNNTFSIKSIRDYAFMYELFNSNAALNNGKYTYQIESNINLEYLSADRYKYKGGIAANITGKEVNEGYTNTGVNVGKGTVTINSAVSKYPTIYNPNFKDTFVTVEGFNAFGLFPYLTGSVSNLNIVASKKVDNSFGNTPVNITVGNNNTATFGIISGYVDIGTIDNVNVFGNITIEGTEKAFIGGAVGVLTGNSTASNITTSGTLNSNLTGFSANQGNYLNGNVIGGVVGYTDFALANVYTLLNSMNINKSGVLDSVDLVVGGVVGAGYTAICNNLQNEGTITIGTDSKDASYASLYVAGVIGRHLGQTEQANGLTNYGNITVYNNTSYPTFVCGSVNATPITKNVANLEVNNYKSNGKYYYRATKIINGANITINKTSDNNHYTDVINVITNECVTRLSGVYNLAYSKNRGEANTTPLGAKSILMNKFSTYSPVLNYEHTGSYDEAIISTVYNLRDIEYTMDDVISTNVTYTGVIKGTNVSMIDVRNEGNLTFTIDKALTGNLNIFGIIEEISGSATASSLYNGGDIKVAYTAQITGNVNISGICYKNNNTSLNTSINNYNPNLDTFDANALGAMDSTINAGNIELTNSDYETDITYQPKEVVSSNKNQLLAFMYNPKYTGSYIKGNINVSGITNINYSIITNTFNIGDMFVANVCKDNGYKINAAGITDLNIGQYAYILNSGNNGDIKAINLYNRTDNSVSSSTLIRTDLTVAGIIARNDLTDSLENYDSNKGHSKQIVAFTINYGSVYAYNYNENIEGSNEEPNCKASGIIGMGLLNVINVLNYGNIFGSETISGIFGVVYFSRFENEVSTDNPVKIANTINYGNTFILYKGYNSGDRASEASSRGTYDYNIIDYSMFKSFDLNYDTFDYSGNKYRPKSTSKGNENYGNDAEIDGVNLHIDEISGSQNRIDYANYYVSREINNKSINGSVFSIINFNNSEKAENVTIRYMINFEESVSLVGFEPATPSNVTVDRSTIYSAYATIDNRNNGSGQMIRDTYMAYIDEDHSNYVVYSPLTDDTEEYITTVKSHPTSQVDVEHPVRLENIQYSGVFSKTFDFYKAINKTYTKAEIIANPTDAFLSDFFQFVEYSYINDVLAEKIGWKEIAYIAAANSFARSASRIDVLINKISTDKEYLYDYSSYAKYALENTSIWTKWATNETLILIINNLIKNNELSDLKTILNYVFSNGSSSNVLLTIENRKSLYNVVKENLSSEALLEVLKNIITYENGYSKALADAVLDGSSEVYSFINNYLTELATNEPDAVLNLLNSYIEIMNGKTTEYFNYSTNPQAKYKILNTMFDGIDNNYFYKTLCEVLDISGLSDVSDKVKMYDSYSLLDDNAKFELFLKIIENNDESKLTAYLSKMEGEIGLYSRLIETGYVTSSLTDVHSQVGVSVTDNTDESVINERVSLWNQIKNTSTFKDYLKIKMNQTTYYFPATEHNNTYQSNTAPADSGAKAGDLSYYYTSTVTPSTYFYGPYSYAYDNGAALIYPEEDTSNRVYYNKGASYRDLTLGDGQVLAPIAGSMTGKSTSVFIADNLSYFGGYYVFNTDRRGSKINNYRLLTKENPETYDIGSNYIKGVGDAALFLYEYGYTGANNQMTSVSTAASFYYKDGKKTDFGGSVFKTTDAYIMFGTTRIDISEGFISPHYNKSRDSGYFEIIDSNGKKYTINGAFYVYDTNLTTRTAETNINPDYYDIALDQTETPNYIYYHNSGDESWGDLLVRYARNYYYSLVSADYHKTRRTGIYKYKSGFSSDAQEYAVTWFTNKVDTTAVFTSQTMDYSVEQLLELDGVYTNYSGNPQSSQERDIINRIFNYYLSPDSDTFKQIISKSLLETLPFDTTTRHLNVNWKMGINSAICDTNAITVNNNSATINRDYQTNFYADPYKIEGNISYNYDGKQYYAMIRIWNLTFTGSLCTGGNVYVKTYSTGKDGDSCKNPKCTFVNNLLTVSFEKSLNNTSSNNCTFTVPINVTTSMAIDTNSLSSHLSLIDNGNKTYTIKDGDAIISTISCLNNVATYSNNNYYTFINTDYGATTGLSFDYILSSNINYNYIDQFSIANINSDSEITSKVPFEYLNYSTVSTMRQYLINSSTITMTDYKKLLISTVNSNELKYYSLIDHLLKFNVLTSEELDAAFDVTITGATGINSRLNDTQTCELYYDGIKYNDYIYKSSNEYGFTASSLELSNLQNEDIIIYAKGIDASSPMSVVSNCSAEEVDLNNSMKVITADETISNYSGNVSNASTYIYKIPKSSLYDYEELTVNMLDTEYYIYDSDSKTYTSVGTLFPSGIEYYRAIGNGKYQETADISNSKWFKNPYQFYTWAGGNNYNPVNDITKTYYRKKSNMTPSITLSMPNNNVVIYDIKYAHSGTETYTKEVTFTEYYYQSNPGKNGDGKNGDATSMTLFTLDTLKSNGVLTPAYSSANNNNTSSNIASELTGRGFTPDVSSYATSYEIQNVDAQFIIWNNYDNLSLYSGVIDTTINSSIVGGTTIADYVFSSVGLLTETEFNNSRNTLYYRNGLTSGATYNNDNLTTNNFLGSDGYYYSKVDFATRSGYNVTITKGSYSSNIEYYNLSFNIPGTLAQFYGKFNNEEILTTNNTYIDSISRSSSIDVYTFNTNNGDGLRGFCGRYNLQRGILDHTGHNSNNVYSNVRINAGSFIMGYDGIGVLSPSKTTAAKIKNLQTWITPSNYSSVATASCNNSSTTTSLIPVSSANVYDYYNSTNYSRLIDVDSIDNLSINLYNVNDTSSSHLGHTLTTYRTENANNNKMCSPLVSGTGNIFLEQILYKVTYKMTYTMQYDSNITDFSINKTLDNRDDYLSARYYGSTSSQVSADNHIGDYKKIICNLMALCTNDYAYTQVSINSSTFDASKHYIATQDSYGNMEFTLASSYDSTKTYYVVNETYMATLENWLLEYLKDHPIDDYTLEQFYILLACSSNESFVNFLNSLYAENPSNLQTIYTLLLDKMITFNNGYMYVSDLITKYHIISLDERFAAETKEECDRYITAAALASDYENQYQQSIAANNSALLASSKLKELLEDVNVTYKGTSIQYINNDGSFDNDKFDALLKYIGSGGNNDVYGIYALSSSKGIKNGDFIPDNLNLESHNAYYKKSKYTLDTNDVYVLELLPETSLDYAYWRKQGDDLATKYGDKYTGDNATTYSDSVNYAFLIEMKQLQKSIATTLFELDLNTSVATSQLSDYTMYSSQSLINEITKASDAKEKNHYAITYYVPSVYLEDIITNNKQLEIVELIKSSSATVYTDTAKTQEAKIRTESIAGTKFSGFVPATSLSSNTNYRSLDGCYVLENAIIIRAEDERVYSYYDILLRPMDFSFDMKYQEIENVTNYYGTFSQTSATVESTDGVISLNLTSPVIYVNTTDTTAKPGAVYYTRTGTEGNYVYTKADLTVGQSINPNNYYSTYTKAVEAGFREGITYYTKSGDTYTAADLTNHVITDNTYYIASEATKLPTGFDLAPYVKIRKQGSGGASIPNSFTLLNEAGNHVVKADGSADITLEILDTLEAGNYDVVVDLYGAEVKLPLTKLPNTKNDFSAIYDGKKLVFNDDGIATTDILWGQPFAKYALENLSYLDSFEASPNSTVEVTTVFDESDVVNGNNVNYNRVTYIVKIDVTSESGVVKHYQHKLVEMDPFSTKVDDELVANDLYATLYEDGVFIGNAKLGEDITNSDKWTVKDNIMNVSFSRDKGEPNYRAKYSYKNIYYSLNNNVYSYEEYDTLGNIINTESSVKILYAGFNVVVTSACDTGTYTFGYVMNNPTYQEIDYYEYDEENNNYFITADILAIKDKDYYTYNLETAEYSKATLAENAELAKSRKLVFPKLRIKKTPSLNALVESATFIDGYEALGALATLVYPDYSIVPSNQVKAYNSNEPIYSRLIDGTQKISVAPTDRHITYKYTGENGTTNYATSTNNYYIVGTTSDASLERYAPTITLQDDYAKLFRFVSPYRNNNYDGKQEATDYSILNNHNDDQIYLYVPFEIDGEEDVLMVKVNVKDMSYEEVWDTTLTKCYASYNKGDGTLKKDGENPAPYKGKELYDITFEYGDQTYKVSHYAGSVSANNSSLFDSYAEECENSRFWYVSYVVFSEDFFMNGLGKEPSGETTTTADWGNRIKYYNVAIIDVSNNIRFILEVDAPEGFMTETNLESIYTTFAYNKYSSTILTDTKQLSAYVEYKDKLYVKNGDDYVLTTGALDGSTQYYFYDQTTKGYIPVEWSTKGTVCDTYVSNYGIQLLPTAYYRFNLDLPSGYVATYKASKKNTYNPETSEISEDGSYLPPSSIVTQTIKITITIERGNVENTSSWGISTSNVTTIVATEKTN